MSVKKDLLKQRKQSRKVVQKLTSGGASISDLKLSSNDELIEALCRRYPHDELLLEHFSRLEEDNDSI